MLHRSIHLLWFVLLAVAVPVAAQQGALPPADQPKAATQQANAPNADHQERLAFFEAKIRPVLVEHCYECHSAKAVEAGKLRGRLRLDLRSGMRQGGESGPAIVPGKPDESLLISALKHEAFEMPPKGKLPDALIADFVKWIEMGAPDPRDGRAAEASPTIDVQAGRQFWSFQPLSSPPVPEDPTAWSRTQIDRFILARLEASGLHPNPEAPARILVRRAWFDLLGLPPTPQQVQQWVERLTRDAPANGRTVNQQAWEQLIDQLLESPHYGERWARHWMDVARFAESHGYEQDYDRPNAFHYRDFLIRAFNHDMPYDQFVRWQLAGDELAPEQPLAWMATGFLGAGPFPTQLTEAEFESARYDELDDMVATTGVAFLGLSIGCARCHDHKFDPIPSGDYYRLAATFTTAIRCEKELDLQTLDGPPTASESHRTPTDGDQQSAPPPAQLVKVMVTSEGLPHLSHHADERGFPHFYPQTHFLRRGDVHQKGDVATPGFLQVLLTDGYDASHWEAKESEAKHQTSYRRAALAHWITDVQHGAGALAARVIVNRLWQHHFGEGIVNTPNDFGAAGSPPTHPELLDWLAADLIEGQWKLKRLHKRIMTSSVYMQSSQYDQSRAAIDPENRWHWRRVPRRLEAEAIRDAMLAVSGQLDTTMYGPGTLDPNMRRRSVYFFIKRSQLIPMMMLFDWPEHLVSIGRRASTTIAPQALMFINSPQGRQYAEGMAARLPEMPTDQAIQHAYWLAFGRSPSQTELSLSERFLERQAATYREAGHAAAERLALIDVCQTLMGMNEFIYVD